MKLIEDVAFLIKSQPYGESDLIVHLLTESHGKISCFAKSAQKSKRRFGNAIDYGNLLDIVFSKRPTSNLLLLNQAEIKKSYSTIRNSLRAHALIQYLLDLISELIPMEMNSLSMFHLLEEIYTHLDGTIQPEVLLCYCELTALRQGGFSLEVHECDTCLMGPPNGYFFSASNQGITCRHFNDKSNRPIPAEVIHFLKSLHESNFDQLSKFSFSQNTFKEYRPIIEKWLEFHLNKQLKTTGYLNDCFSEFR